MSQNVGGVNGLTTYSIEVQEVPRYEVIGADSQVVNVAVQPGETVTCEPGTMMHMHPDIKGDVACADNVCGCKAVIGGEKRVKLKYTNSGGEVAFIGLTPNFPAKVVPLPVPAGQSIHCKMGGWMGNIDTIDIDFSLDCNPATACCGGLGCIRQQLKGGDTGGTAFLAAGGTIVVKELQAEEKILIDTDSLVAWDEGVEMDIRMAGNLCMACFGGEGLFNTVMTGPGRVVMQSMSFEKLRRALMIVPPNVSDNAGGSAPTEAEMER